MALEWEKEDERQVGLLLKTDPEDPMQVRHGSAILKVMDAILNNLIEGYKEEADDVPES